MLTRRPDETARRCAGSAPATCRCPCPSRRARPPSPRHVSVTSMRPFLLVNFTELVSRFHTICCSRSGSPKIGPTLASRSTRDLDLFRFGGRFHRIHRRLDHAGQLHAAHVEAQVPGHDAGHVEQVFDELRLRARVPLRPLRARASRCESFRLPLRSSLTQPKIALSGVRSSCETVATNSSLLRLEALGGARALPARDRARPACGAPPRDARSHPGTPARCR